SGGRVSGAGRSAGTHEFRVTPIAVVVTDAVAGVADIERQLRHAGDIGGQVLGGLATSHHPGRRDLDAVREHAERDAALAGGRVVYPNVAGERRAAGRNVDHDAADRVGAEPLGVADAVDAQRASVVRARSADVLVTLYRPKSVHGRHERAIADVHDRLRYHRQPVRGAGRTGGGPLPVRRDRRDGVAALRDVVGDRDRP